MKINELRVGNWYLSVKFGVPVRCELSDLYELCVMSDGAYNDPPIDEMFKPIPITEEWLVKFGFEKTRDEASPYIDGEHTVISGRFTVFSKIPLTFNSVHGWFLNKHQTELIIKYVHQLQDLYLALTREELETA